MPSIAGGTGHEVEISWNGRPARAWVPVPLADRALDLPIGSARATERAAGAVQRVGDRLPRGWEPLARLLLRAEGIASSNIEGLRAPAPLVAAAQLDVNAATPTAATVADNLAIVTSALDHARSSGPVTATELHTWQARVVQHGYLDAHLVGAFRNAQGWIGGRSPHDAAYVGPPPDLVAPLMHDLLAFVNETDVDPITAAAVAHAQFETVHPYGDGNGRVGRLLVLWLLARRLDVAVPPSTSVLIARDPGGYLAGLHWFRTGELARWIDWFADVVESASRAALEWAGEVDALMADWRSRLDGVRRDAAARVILELLPAHPVISPDVAAREAGISASAARTALEALGARGIVEPYAVPAAGPGRPRRWWLARALAELVGAWAR